MAHIPLINEQELPGITGLLHYSPVTAQPLLLLADTLLHNPNTSTLTPGEREIIASSVSFWNDCHFCHASHGAAAAAHLQTDLCLIDDIKQNFEGKNISPKLQALLQLAKQVQQGGKMVTETHIAQAKQAGATDHEIHDTVLIAAAFCMFNRYVDGLGTWQPSENEAYKTMGERMAQHGYIRKH
ncbi:MAG: peroxidase-related enzyme [Sphingobacteriales bacterium]|jgi:uncharacterized peroxidase-related enzyme|nr:peroxidase-related enzyme [Sphingobacteriales bacterium]MBP9140943.1 peroxidase-related enzyme [Chitinophagales bacterium]MDA0198733.1 peroxidase-related enzyme [Bacteroidota bacterium]MBK7528145.1 peroxidase-related enzyme [Sphingobacteriales bacterium]MBK8679776.1 peroxidase-related enzyme [Sphingobacteriales bacterium]